jgi:hypothetical protein
LSGGRGYSAGGAEGGGSPDDRADVGGILHTGKNNQKWRASGRRSAKKVVKRGGARLHESGDALGMLGVGKAFKKAIGGAEQRKSDFGPVDERGETPAVALAGFAEEDSFNMTAGTEGLFDEADAFDTDAAGLGGQAAPEGHAKGLEPAIVAAGENRRCA